MTLSAAIIYLMGVLTGGGWGLVVGLRNARDIALDRTQVAPNVRALLQAGTPDDRGAQRRP